MMDERLDYEDHEENKRSPIIYILTTFLFLLVVLMAIPYYGIRSDPSPTYIPELEDVMSGLVIDNATRLSDIEQINYVQVDPFLKTVSARVARSCDTSRKVCYSKAFFIFVRDEISYISDPDFEYIESAELVLNSGSADCDGKSILLVSFLKSVGVPSRIVIGNNHAFVQAYLPDALESYKTEGEWVSLDPSCSNCEFGEVNPRYLNNIYDVVYVN